MTPDRRPDQPRLLRALAATYAFIPPLMIWSASWRYASEGRPYGLAMGCAVVAVLSWQDDTSALLLSVLRRYAPLRIEELDVVLAANPRFILAAMGGDYLQWHLAALGYRVVPVAGSADPVLYDVETQGSPEVPR